MFEQAAMLLAAKVAIPGFGAKDVADYDGQCHRDSKQEKKLNQNLKAVGGWLRTPTSDRVVVSDGDVSEV